MTRSISSIPYWLIATVAALFFMNLGGYLLFDHDEGAFSEATRGMFERGDFITTYLNDRVRFDKPILIYWLQAASISLFGTEVWAFRLPSALAGIAWSLATFTFVRRFIDHQTAVVACLIMALSLGVNGISHVATADALLNALMASSLLLIYVYSVQPSQKTLYAVYALMGLGVLTKGPVAVAIPLMVAGLFYLWSDKQTLLWKALFFIPGWILFLAIAAPWYILEYLAQGQAFIDGFILKHNVNRFNNAMEGHDGGPFFYLLVLPFLLAPFGALFVRIFPSVRSVMSVDTQNTDALLNRFLWIWFVVVLVLFSIASTKLPHYILYGITPLIIMMARDRNLLKRRWLAVILPSLFFALIVAFPLLIPTIKEGLTNPIEIAIADRASLFVNHAFALWAALAWVLSVALILWPKLSIWQGLIASGVVQLLLVWFVVIPAFSDAQQRPVYEAAQFAKTLDKPIYTQSIDMPSFNVYLDKVTERRTINVGEIGYAREDRLKHIPHYDVLFQSGPIMIIRRLDAPDVQP